MKPELRKKYIQEILVELMKHEPYEEFLSAMRDDELIKMHAHMLRINEEIRINDNDAKNSVRK